MDDLYKLIGSKIKELRENYGGKGVSQEELAKEMETTANTISRWETATYKPSVQDLHRMAEFFGVGIETFFPHTGRTDSSLLRALMSATGNLREQDINELVEYFQFRAARQKLNKAKGVRTSRKS
jgi:transcriptional regulator with XRE-family HTH domain